MNFAQAWFEKEPRCLCLSDAIRFDPGWDRRCTWWMFHHVTVSSYVEYVFIWVLGSFGINLEVKLDGSLGNLVRRALMFLKIPDVIHDCYWAKGTSTRRVREQFPATTSRHYSFRYWENACPTKMFCWPVVSLQNRRLGAESVRMCLMSLWKHGNPTTGFGRWAVYWKWSKVRWTLAQHSAHQTQIFTAVVLRSSHFQRTAMLTLWTCWGNMWWPAAAWSCGLDPLEVKWLVLHIVLPTVVVIIIDNPPLNQGYNESFGFSGRCGLLWSLPLPLLLVFCVWIETMFWPHLKPLAGL